jgi:hypothetical protein
MTPEIENLRALWGVAKQKAKDAKAAEDAAQQALDNAIANWAEDDLKARGIVIGVTPVQYATHRAYEGRPFHFSSYHGPCAVVDVRGSHGVPIYRVNALTKTGALSKSRGAYDAWAYAVRPWGQA